MNKRLLFSVLACVCALYGTVGCSPTDVPAPAQISDASAPPTPLASPADNLADADGIQPGDTKRAEYSAILHRLAQGESADDESVGRMVGRTTQLINERGAAKEPETCLRTLHALDEVEGGKTHLPIKDAATMYVLLRSPKEDE